MIPEVVIAGLVSFVLSFSLIINGLLVIVSAGLGWFSKNSFETSQKLSNRLFDLEERISMYKNLDLFLEELAMLEMLLKELRSKELFMTDPDLEEVHNRLMNLLSVIEDETQQEEP